jgi:hypothetical protein
MWNCERTHKQVGNTQTTNSKQNDVQLVLNILPHSYEGVIQNISTQDQLVNFEWLKTKLLNESHKNAIMSKPIGRWWIYLLSNYNNHHFEENEDNIAIMEEDPTPTKSFWV